jgi:hypothetical protein
MVMKETIISRLQNTKVRGVSTNTLRRFQVTITHSKYAFFRTGLIGTVCGTVTQSEKVVASQTKSTVPFVVLLDSSSTSMTWALVVREELMGGNNTGAWVGGK